MELLDCEDIRAAVQEIAQRDGEKTADRLRAYNLLYGWSKAEHELPPWLQAAGGNGVKVSVNLIDDDTEDTDYNYDDL